MESIARRLSVIAYEDIGLANPAIGPRLDAAINAALRVGMPEARIPLSEIVIEMSLSPKSNSAITAIDKVLADIDTGKCGNIPEHIRITANGLSYSHLIRNSDSTENFELSRRVEFRIRTNAESKMEEILDSLQSKD